MFREWSLSLSRRWPPAARHDRGRDVRGSQRARRDRSWLGIICKDFGSLATHVHVGVHCFAEIYKGSYGYRTYCVWGVCFVPLTMTTQSMMLCVFNKKGVSCDSERVIRIPCTADSVVYRVSGIMQRSSLIQITLAFINPNLLGPRILELLRAVTFRSPYA